MLDISDVAREKILSVLASQEPAVDTLRISSRAPGKFSMSLEPQSAPLPEDTVLPYEGFTVLVDPQSVPYVEGTHLDWVDTYGGGGFQFTSPSSPGPAAKKQAPEGPEGDIWRQIQEVIDEEVNPAVASHGGYIDLMGVEGDTAYILMGGGCQGCGMANVTLKQGVERVIKERVPSIREILDTTDHAGGRNPYYAPATK